MPDKDRDRQYDTEENKAESDLSLKESGLSIVHPFYNDKARLNLHLDVWKTYTDDIKGAIKYVLVDDCSNPPLLSWVDFAIIPLNIAIYRIKEDLKWNTPGALNLGIVQAETDWVLIMDSDCVLLKEDMERLLNFKPVVGISYFFRRRRITNNPAYQKKQNNVLPCSILLHKDRFNNLNGFDEDFTGAWSGGYGIFDNDFVKRLGRKKSIIEGVIIQEHMDDVIARSESTRSVREKDIMVNLNLYNKKKEEYKKSETTWRQPGKILRFEWEKVK